MHFLFAQFKKKQYLCTRFCEMNDDAIVYGFTIRTVDDTGSMYADDEYNRHRLY